MFQWHVSQTTTMMDLQQQHLFPPSSPSSCLPGNKSDRTDRETVRLSSEPAHQQFNSSSRSLLPLQLCFLTCEFSASVEEADLLPIIDPSMRRPSSSSSSNTNTNTNTNTSASFNVDHFVFTNLPELPAQERGGWTKIVMTEQDSLPYHRLITQSRWPKFLGWQHEQLQHCEIIFYGDAYMMNPVNESFWQEIGRTIQSSTVGLMQSKQPYAQSIAHELHKNVKLGKLSPEAAAYTNQWFKRQSDYKRGPATPVYKNALFGYDPHNANYRAMSLDFWKEYSKELGSWRDQPYWAYFLSRHHMKPLEFALKLPDFNHVDDTTTITTTTTGRPAKRMMGDRASEYLPFGVPGTLGHNGHTYVKVDTKAWKTKGLAASV
jgi:hypothetical protein